MSETDPNPVPLPGECPEACVDRILADAGWDRVPQ